MMAKWGSPVEIERRKRILIALWAYAYEFQSESLVDDATFDQTGYETLYTFPTFMQNYTWNKQGDKDESISFQTVEGLSVNADIGISYHIDPTKVATLFQTYRTGVQEITDVYLRNIVRDQLVIAASTRPIETVYGSGKAALLDEVQKETTERVAALGIVIDGLSWVGELRLPVSVVQSINAKIGATQMAQQRENEVKTAQAEAQKEVAAATGRAQARLLEAQAEADANRKVAASITPELVQYELAKKWNGAQPQVIGGGTPLLQINK